jgi:hypothetical protein
VRRLMECSNCGGRLWIRIVCVIASNGLEAPDDELMTWECAHCHRIKNVDTNQLRLNFHDATTPIDN